MSSKFGHVKPRIRTGSVRKGQPFGRIIKSEKRRDGRTWELHATRGWRDYRAS